MKNRSYRLTDTGIRIPLRKIKWISPHQDNSSVELELLSPRGVKLPFLFVQNINVLLQAQTPSDSANIIDIGYQEGGTFDAT